MAIICSACQNGRKKLPAQGRPAARRCCHRILAARIPLRQLERSEVSAIHHSSLLMRTRLAALTLAFCVVAVPARAQKADSTAHIAIRAGRLIDGRGGPPISNAVILIDGDRITAVGSGLTIPANARVIDLRRSTVLPGLIDCHTHVTAPPMDYYEEIFRRSPSDEPVTAHLSAKRTLDAGF